MQFVIVMFHPKSPYAIIVVELQLHLLRSQAAVEGRSITARNFNGGMTSVASLRIS